MVPSPPATHSVVVLSKPGRPFPPCDWLSNPSAWENHNFLMTTRKTLMIMIFLSPIKLTGSVLESPPLTAQSHFLVFMRGEPLKCQKSWAFSCPDSSIPIYPYSDQTNVGHEISPHEWSHDQHPDQDILTETMTMIIKPKYDLKFWRQVSFRISLFVGDKKALHNTYKCTLYIFNTPNFTQVLDMFLTIHLTILFKSEVLSTFYTAFLLFYYVSYFACELAGSPGEVFFVILQVLYLKEALKSENH